MMYIVRRSQYVFLSAFISPHIAGYKIMLQNNTYIARWY